MDNKDVEMKMDTLIRRLKEERGFKVEVEDDDMDALIRRLEEKKEFKVDIDDDDDEYDDDDEDDESIEDWLENRREFERLISIGHLVDLIVALSQHGSGAFFIGLSIWFIIVYLVALISLAVLSVTTSHYFAIVFLVVGFPLWYAIYCYTTKKQ